MNRFTSARPTVPEVAPPCSPAAPRDADVIVVGAGPAGSTTAYHLAQAGLDVLLLEKTEFPREKVCGDGLTPRAVEVAGLDGHRHQPRAGWLHNKGLRIIGGGMRLEIPWPELAQLPGVRPGAARASTSTTCSPGTRGQGRRGPARAHHRHRRRCWTRPAGSPASPPRATTRRGHLPRAAGRRRRRQLHPAVARDGPATSATTGRWASRSAPTTRARGTTTTGWSPGWSCGTG